MQAYPFVFLIIIFESNTTCVICEINNSKAKVVVAANHVKIIFASD